MRFRRLVETTERDVLSYSLRRVDRPADAADVVAETYLVAWRKIDQVPDGDSAKPWLLGVARRNLANLRRGHQRRERLSDRLRVELSSRPVHILDADDGSVGEVGEALARLSDEDREILTLSTWDELQPAEIAQVLGLKKATARSRLHRAKERFKVELDRVAEPPAVSNIGSEGGDHG